MKRGVGRYSMALTQALLRNRGEHDIFVLLSTLRPETVPPIRHALAGAIDMQRIVTWTAPSPVAWLTPLTHWRRSLGEILRAQAIASLRPDVVLISHGFEGLTEEALTGPIAPNERLYTASVLYDLIPLLNRDTYLQDPRVEAWYLSRLQGVLSADLLLAISNATVTEAALRLGHRNMVNISAAVDTMFNSNVIEGGAARDVRRRYGITDRFILYTGGIDPRKNIDNLIRSIKYLPLELRDTTQLVIVCAVEDTERTRLQRLAEGMGIKDGNFLLPGFVPDSDLVALYNMCSLFVFPSWHEGFGMPILEAMSCGAAVIAADIPSSREIIDLSQALFDPNDPFSIAQKITEVLTDERFRLDLQQHALTRSHCFSWDRTALLALGAMTDLYAQREAPSVRLSHRPKLAYVSPLPPLRSGIADYSATLLPELARYYDIDLVVDQEDISDPFLSANFPVRQWQWFDTHAKDYERIVYQFGNSAFHSHMFGLVRRHPGVVVLHDMGLGGILSHLELSGEQPGVWTNALFKSHGYSAVQRRFQPGIDLREVIWEFPANLPVLEAASGVVVHSRYNLAHIQEDFGDHDLAEFIPLLSGPAQLRDKADAKQRLGIPRAAFLVCSFGQVAEVKLSRVIIEAWMLSPLVNDPNCRLVFVGANDPGEYGADLARLLQQHPNCGVTLAGRVERDTYEDYLDAADVAIQLRAPGHGESLSAGLLDTMSHGAAAVVNSTGALNEFPLDCIVTLPPQPTTEDIATVLVDLEHRPRAREELGRAAHTYVTADRNPTRIAAQYMQFIERSFEHSAHRQLERAIAEVRSLAAENAPGHAALEEAAQALVANNRPFRKPQLLLDVSGMSADSAILGVVRALLTENGHRRVEVVRRHDGSVWYDRPYACSLLGLPSMFPNEPVDLHCDDVFLVVRDEFAGKEPLPDNRGCRTYLLIAAPLIAGLAPEAVTTMTAVYAYESSMGRTLGVEPSGATLLSKPVPVDDIDTYTLLARELLRLMDV